MGVRRRRRRHRHGSKRKSDAFVYIRLAEVADGAAAHGPFNGKFNQH